MLSLTLLSLSLVGVGASNCVDFEDCAACTSHNTWIPGAHCRWCPQSGGGCHAGLSWLNPCHSTQNIYDTDKCEASPKPAEPAPPVSPFATRVLGLIFKFYHIKADPNECIADVSRVDVKFADFAANVKADRLDPAAEDLSLALSGLATAMTGCGGNATVLQTELRALAAASRVIKITGTVDEDIKVLASAIESGKSDAIADALSKLLADWTTITNGCASGNTACKVIEGLLKVLSVVAKDVTPCEAALMPVLSDFDTAVAAFDAKNYTQAVQQFATGLDLLAKAIGSDSCGLKGVADVISTAAPQLKAAIVKLESSSSVRIIVGSADVYDTLYQAVLDLRTGDAEGFGMQMGVLLAKMRAGRCTTAACDVLEGLLASLQLAGQDYAACTAQLDTTFPEFEAAIHEVSAGHLQAGAQDLGKSLVGFAQAVKSCGLADFAEIAEKLAAQLNATSAEAKIGQVVQVLIEGADVTLDLQKLVADGQAKQWSAVGSDLGVLASWLSSTGCSSFVCKLVEGVLNGAAIPFKSLEACVGDLRSAESTFTAGANAFAHKQYKAAMTYWAAGLDDVAKSVGACQLAEELEYVKQEAQVLGFGHIKILDQAAQILVHGSDVYEELYHAFQSIESKDYRSAGADIGKVLDQLSQWTKGHACTSDFCYVVLGMFEFLGDIQGDIRACESDFKLGFANFSSAFKLLRNASASEAAAGTSHDFFFNREGVKEGVRAIGYGLEDIAKGTSDCHLAQLADILARLAAKLGIAPEVVWVEDTLHILIEAVNIEEELGTACLDYSDGNWVGFGYNLVKLMKTLLGNEAMMSVQGTRAKEIVI